MNKAPPQTAQDSQSLHEEGLTTSSEKSPPSPPATERPRIRTILRHSRHALTLFFAGVLASEFFEEPRVIPVPDGKHHTTFEELTPKERRYREKLAALLQELTGRWPGALQGTTIQKGGTFSAELAQRNATPEGIYHEKMDDTTLTLSFDRTGAVTHLYEEQKGKTIDVWPQHKDLRITMTHDDRTEYTWWTVADGLYGVRSADGSLKSFFIEGEGVIDPKTPPAILLQKLSTPHRIFLFQKIFATYQDHTFIQDTGKIDRSQFAKFFCQFRLSLADWQKGEYANGSCNTYAETTCEVLSASTHEHYPMHILTYWPSDGKKRFSKPWHQTAAYPMPNGEWCIVDGSMDRLTYVPSPDIYGKEWDSELATTPILGRFPWKAEHHGPTYRFLQHLHIPKGKGNSSVTPPVSAELHRPSPAQCDAQSSAQVSRRSLS